MFDILGFEIPRPLQLYYEETIKKKIKINSIIFRFFSYLLRND